MSLVVNNRSLRDQAFEAKLASSRLKLEQALAQNGGKLPEVKEAPDTRSNAQKEWAQFPSGGCSGTE